MFDGAPRSAFSFRRETFAGTIDEALPMLSRQWIEAGEEGVGDFDLAMDRYHKAEQAGVFRVYTARHQGVFVGFAAFFVFYGMHARGTKAAMSDAFGVSPEFRRPTVAIRLLRFSESMLSMEGVKIIHFAANEAIPAAARLLEHLGYQPISRTYAKVIPNA
jgi:GNAT superfamily N-acetyltransferase